MSDTNPNRLTDNEVENSRNENALQRRKRRNANRGGTAVADWRDSDASLLQELVASVTLQKGTITLGYTKDGSCYYVSYYFGKESEAFYCRPSEGIDEFLAEEIEAFSS